MSRLTITLSDDLHRALKETAARRGCTIGQIIEESLLLRGIKSIKSALTLVERARSGSMTSEEQAISLATEETRAHRSI